MFETAAQRDVIERFVVDWRLKPLAFVGQERTILVPERVTSNRGPTGFAMTVVTTESISVLPIAVHWITLSSPSPLVRILTDAQPTGPMPS